MKNKEDKELKKRYMSRMLYYSDDATDNAHSTAIAHVGYGSYVLSCGCGSGREVVALKERHCKITAIDNDADMIRSSKARGEAEYILGNFASFHRENCYDHIICLFDTVAYLSKAELEEFADNCFKNLKPNGTLIITFKSRYQSIKTLYWYLFKGHKRLSLSQANKLLNKFDSTHTKLDGWYLLWCKKVINGKKRN